MLALGTPLPLFDLEVVQGTKIGGPFWEKGLTRISNENLKKVPLLLMVICAHCPFVKHVESALTELDDDYRNKVQIIAVSSNSLITHPQDGPEFLRDQANRFAWKFPYLLDIDQTFAKSLKAACTPDFFIFSTSEDTMHKLRYRGQIDESRPGNEIALTGKDLRQALDAVLEEREVCLDQKPSIGCNIKWKPGSEPPWFG